MTAFLHEDVVESECNQHVIVDVGAEAAMTQEPLSAQNSRPCLAVAEKKVWEHYAKMGKVPSSVQVVPSDFGPKRLGGV